MGNLIYGSGERRIHFDDRTLAHVKSVIITKLRRQECFTLTWLADRGTDRRRVTLWIHPSIPMEFEFDGIERAELNRAWLELMIVDAAASGEIFIADEPAHISA